MLDTASLVRLLAQPKKIVITTHHKPDGDAMGSSLGLYNYLIQQGHHVIVITPTDYPYYFNWMPGNDNVIIYTDRAEESAGVDERSAGRTNHPPGQANRRALGV